MSIMRKEYLDGGVLGSFILELCIATPGAFLLALIKGKPKNTGQIMNDHYILSIAVGIGCWALLVALIKFMLYGCVVCN